MYHRNVLLAALAILYYGSTTYALYSFDAGLLVTAIFIFGLPTLFLAHFTHAPLPVILSVTFVGAGLGVMLEGIAHTYGLWYTLGSSELRILSVLPLESVVFVALQTLFLSLLYEALFDDGIYAEHTARERVVAFGVLTFGVFGLVVLHQYLMKGIFMEHSYVWLVGTTIAASFTMHLLYHRFSVRFLDRIVDFALIAFIPSSLALWLSFENLHKIFANPDAYLFSVSVLGHLVPIEEILLIVTVPLLVATVYELYLDDRA